MSTYNSLNPVMLPVARKVVFSDAEKSPDQLGKEFASIFFKQMIHQMLNTAHSNEDHQNDLWKHYQGELFAQQVANSAMATPICQAISQDIIRLQELQGGVHAQKSS